MRMIDADEMIKRLQEWNTNDDMDKPLYNFTMHRILEQPTIEPERKTGKWNTYYHSDIEFSYSCNQCGYSAPYQMIGGEVFQKKWNFCPNCGARMEVKHEKID